MCATSAYSSRFITYAPIFIFLGKLFLEKTPLNNITPLIDIII